MENYLMNLPQYGWAIIAIAVTSLLFLLYYYLSEAGFLKRIIERSVGTKKAQSTFIQFRRGLGFFLFGLIPWLLILAYHPKDFDLFGLTFDNLGTSFLWILGLSPLILLMNYLNAGKKDNLAMYPQIREKHWSKRLLGASALTWILYLLGYEFLFRAFLLFASYYALDLTSALVINVCLYSLVHLPKGIKETLGAIPLGLLLSYLTIETNSLLIAVVIHIIMALSNEWFSLRAHPEMQIKKS